jgi:hypothetical protein
MRSIFTFRDYESVTWIKRLPQCTYEAGLDGWPCPASSPVIRGVEHLIGAFG